MAAPLLLAINVVGVIDQPLRPGVEWGVLVSRWVPSYGIGMPGEADVTAGGLDTTMFEPGPEGLTWPPSA